MSSLLHCLCFPFHTVSIPCPLTNLLLESSEEFVCDWAAVRENTFRNPDPREPQETAPVFIGRSAWRNTSQAVCCELRRFSFGNLMVSCLLAGAYVNCSIFLQKRTVQIQLEERVMNLPPQTSQLPIFLQSYGVNKETNSLNDLANLCVI